MSQLIACPDCQKQLQVPDDLIGKTVQCPECKHTFAAALAVEAEKARVDIAETTPWKEPVPDDDRSERKSKREMHDEHDHDDEDLDIERGSKRRGFRCPFCGSREPTQTRSQISVGGWVVFAVMLFFCFPLFWIGLLMTEEYHVCSECGHKIGG